MWDFNLPTEEEAQAVPVTTRSKNSTDTSTTDKK